MAKLKIVLDKLRKNKWEIIDWTMFFVCLFSSYYFFIGTWEDFVARKSSFTIEEQQIMGQPSVTITFSNQDGSIWDRSMFELGSEVNITYHIMDSKSILATVPLTEKNNTIPELQGEVISLRKFKSAYKITSSHPEYEHKNSQERVIQVVFSPEIEKEKLPAKVTFHFSSEENSYGVESQKYHDGEVFVTEIERGTKSAPLEPFAHVIIKPKLKKILQEKTGCSDESYWEQFQPGYIAKVKDKCPSPCVSRGMPDKSFEVCQTFSDWTCSEEEFKKSLKGFDHIVPCTTIGYHGNLQAMASINMARTDQGPISLIANKWNGEPSVIITYMFETPEQMAVREEYIVVPAFKMIGDIGGILGIFIGFAFSPFVTQIIECCQYLISIIFVKWTGRNNQFNKTFINALWIAIDWVAFFTLGTIALVSVQGIWSDYTNTKTSLSWSSEAISSHPTITMCFSLKGDYPKMFDIQTEMNITYTINSTKYMILNEKDNKSPEFGKEVVHLERLKNCYKISTKAIPIKREERTIKVEISLSPHLDVIDLVKRLPINIWFILTSAMNSFGVEEEFYPEGNPYEVPITLQHHRKVILKPKKIDYLKEMRGGCEDSGFWNVVESEFAYEIKRQCPLPCAPMKLPNGTLGDCVKMGVPETEIKCSTIILFGVINSVLQNGFTPCTKIEYPGKESDYVQIVEGKGLVRDDFGKPEVVIPPNFNGKVIVIFSYKFDNPETTDVFSEYIIVDTMTMIGSIGGTLGLYVGFSFSGFAMQIIGWIQILVVKISQSSFFKEEKKKDNANSKQAQNETNMKLKGNNVKAEKPSVKTVNNLTPSKTNQDISLKNKKKETKPSNKTQVAPKPATNVA